MKTIEIIEPNFEDIEVGDSINVFGETHTLVQTQNRNCVHCSLTRLCDTMNMFPCGKTSYAVFKKIN